MDHVELLLLPSPCPQYSCMLKVSSLADNEQLILTAVIRHLDHKNVSHDPETKSNIIQTATLLARQLRSRGVAAELVVAGDLCKHLRKVLEAVELGGIEELSLNESLQNFLEDCLMEVVRGVCPAQSWSYANVCQRAWMLLVHIFAVFNYMTFTAKTSH
jgi:hypothetical protein